MTDLGHLGGGTSRATAINNNGVIVGWSTRSNGTPYAFSWTQAGGMVDLNALLPLNSGWVLTEANGVNDKGQITGYGLLQRRWASFSIESVPNGQCLDLANGAATRGRIILNSVNSPGCVSTSIDPHVA
jgi:probable HAF family extracellular repeat protein